MAMSRPVAPLFTASFVLALALSTVGMALAATGSVSQAELVPYRDIVFPSSQVQRSIPYREATNPFTGNRETLVLDLYQPVGDTSAGRPVFVFIHGGGFVTGTRLEGRRYAELFARRGWVAVSIQYRLATELSAGSFQTAVRIATEDARAAVVWLRQRSEEYRLDAERVVVAGSSAGAITALYLAYTDLARETGGTPSDVVGVLDLWGSLYNEVNQIQRGDPPLVIVHGTEDALVPFEAAVRLRNRAESVGVPVEWRPIEGAGHAPHDPETYSKWAAEFWHPFLWAAPTTPLPPEPTGMPSVTPHAQPSATATDSTSGMVHMPSVPNH